MKMLRKLFFGLNITWPKLLIFAVVAGVITGVIMQIPALQYTSIQNIGINPEAWALFAVIICTNSKKPLEAACKTFVFFLISQPLVYLTMWPVYHSFPWGYYLWWFYATIATFPLALLAWYIRKQNIGSMCIVLALSTFLLILGFSGIRSVIVHFPFGILSVLFCIAQAAVYCAVLIDSNRKRLIVGIATAVLALAYTIATFGPSSYLGMSFEGAHDYSFQASKEGIVQVSSDAPDNLSFVAQGYGSTLVVGTKPDGTTVTFNVTVDLTGIQVVEMTP